MALLRKNRVGFSGHLAERDGLLFLEVIQLKINFPAKHRFFVPFVLLPLSLPSHAAPNAADLLRSMVGAQKNLNYSGTMQITRPAAPPMIIKVWRSGDKKRLEWMAPPVMRGDVLADDGQSVWQYHRAENSAVQTRGTAEIDWNRLGRSMAASLSGGGNIAGRAAWIVELTPRGKAQPAWKVWIDQKNFARLRVEHTGLAGQTMTLQKVVFAPIADNQFQWSPPAGANITRTNGTLFNERGAAQRAANWLQIPGFVPRGYNFESAVVDPNGAGGKGEAWLRYANGINRFSIFQQRTGDSVAVPARRAGGGWFVQQNGSRYLVLGLSDAQTQKIAVSLK